MNWNYTAATGPEFDGTSPLEAMLEASRKLEELANKNDDRVDAYVMSQKAWDRLEPHFVKDDSVGKTSFYFGSPLLCGTPIHVMPTRSLAVMEAIRLSEEKVRVAFVDCEPSESWEH